MRQHVEIFLPQTSLAPALESSRSVGRCVPAAPENRYQSPGLICFAPGRPEGASQLYLPLLPRPLIRRQDSVNNL